MAFYIDADKRDRTSTDKTAHESIISYKPTNIRTVQLVELTDKCIDKIANKIAEAKPVVSGEWIPCSDRLPEANGRYLVTRGLNACGAMWNRVYLINYSDLMGLKSEKIWWQGNVGKSDFERIDDVIAWMPLPQQWKGEKNEQIH